MNGFMYFNMNRVFYLNFNLIVSLLGYYYYYFYFS